MHPSISIKASALVCFLLLAGCEGGSPPGDPVAAVSASNPVASNWTSGARPEAAPELGGSEALAARELDPFSLPAGFYADRAPLTPSTTTLPVDETYGGGAGWAFKITQAGSGNAGWFRITSPSSANRMALLATHTGEGIAMRAINTGTGRAFWAQIPEASNPFPAFVATHVGGGEALEAINFGSGEAIVGRSHGTGSAGLFEVVDATSTTPALDVIHQGDLAFGVRIQAPVGLHVRDAGLGFFVQETSTGLDASVENLGFDITSGGTGGFIRAPSRVLSLLKLFGNPAQPAFEILRQVSEGGANRLLTIHDSGMLEANLESITGDMARFQHGSVTKVRFDHTGKGFFDGGTQTGGADIAESFDVEGSVLRYEPGDVLVISTRRDRRVERSAEPYSMRLIGVYATRPGVLLSDEGIDDPSWGRVPVGVVGVVPTKVTTEGGPIRRGDILVSSSRPGHAMKADPERAREGRIPTGAVLGKALEPFDGPGTGLLQVMVNVK